MTQSSTDYATCQLGAQPLIHPTAQVRDCTFGQYCEVGARTSLAEVTMGDYSYVVNDSDIIYTTIGKFANIAAHTRINPGQHPLDRASMHHFQYRSRMYGFGDDDRDFFDWRRSQPVTIGHDVWVGHGAVIMGGVSIATGAVIGSHAVVTRDVPAYAIVIGSPARLLRYRFEDTIQASLQRICWWDWSHEQLSTSLKDFRSCDADTFCRTYDPLFNQTA